MKDLAVLLGHEDTADRIAAALIGEKAILSLSGRSGTGKTELVKRTLKEKLERKGIAVLRLCGDEDKKDQTFIVLESVLAAYRNKKDRKRNVQTGLAKTADGVSPTRLFSGIMTILQNVGGLPARNIENLSTNEITTLELIFSLAKHKVVLIVIDQFMWSDQYSLRFLEKLMCGNFDDERRLSRNLRCLCVVTDEHLEKTGVAVTSEFLAKHIPQHNRFRLERIKKGQIQTTLNYFGFKKELKEKDISYLYQVSEGNLEIISIISRYLLNNGEIHPRIISQDNFIIRTVYKRILHTESDQDWDDCLCQLASYSLIGDRFLKHQSDCMHKNNKDAIQLALKANILREYSCEEFEFSHETHKVMLSNIAQPNKKDIHKKISECLGKIIPSNYEARAHHLFQAGQERDATTFLVVSAIRNLQKLRKLDDVFPLETRELIGLSEHDVTLQVFENAYGHFNANRFKDALTAVNGMANDIPLILQAERDYLDALSRLELHNLKEAHHACGSLETWDDLYEEGETELWARIKVIYLQGLVLQGRIDHARRVEKEIIKKIKKASSHDNALKHLLFVLNRKAAAIKTAPIARRNIEMAKDFFCGGYPDQEPEDILEYYKCLINFSATLINNGEYEKAFNTCREILQLVGHYKYLAFPRVDLLLNNATISAFRSHQIALEFAIEQQIAVLNSTYCKEDDHIQRSNLAGFYILFGKKGDAKRILDELDWELANRGINEGYIVYNALTNRVALNILEKDERAFDETLGRLSGMVEKLEWPAVDDISRRIQKMAECRNDLFDLAPLDLDTFLTGPEHKQTEWDFYGRTVALCELQFWASS